MRLQLPEPYTTSSSAIRGPLSESEHATEEVNRANEARRASFFLIERPTSSSPSYIIIALQLPTSCRPIQIQSRKCTIPDQSSATNGGTAAEVL